jgi:hypothetical protein
VSVRGRPPLKRPKKQLRTSGTSYRGLLAVRPTPTEDESLADAMAALADIPLGTIDRKMIRHGASHGKKDAGAALQRDMEGLELLCQHYRISAVDQTVRFTLLALALARDHVPYFMEPKYSKPRTLQAIMPALDMALRKRNKRYTAEDVLDAFRELPGLKAVSTETFDRELTRWRRRGKEKE